MAVSRADIAILLTPGLLGGPMKPPKEHEEAEGYAAGGRKKRKRRAGGGTASGFMAENRLDKRPRRNLGGGGLPGAGSAMMAPQGAAGLGAAPGLGGAPGLGATPGLGAPGLAAPAPAMPAMPPQGAAGLGAPPMPPQAMGQRPFRRGGRTKQDPKIAKEAREEGESYAHEAGESAAEKADEE